ncbi:MAG TPA: 2-dehydropantoate 2-reductase [Burkholderiaceae bacterium]|nr:2-dehydropantoate 2-reductase [Burkholderiaceae bacterium]
MRILIVGAGATGGYFGARLAKAGRDVTFLVRPARAARLAADGLTVKSPLGDFTIAPRLATADRIDGHHDVVLLTVKAYALEQALTDVAPAVGPATMVVPVLNGLRHLDRISEVFGAQALVGGVCKVGVTLDDQGRIVHMNPMHFLGYGEIDGQRSERTGRLDAAMQGAGFDAQWSTTIVRDLWEKWIMLGAAGAITCLMQAPIGEVVAAPHGHAFASALLDEVVAVAVAAGHPPRDEYVAETRALLTRAGSPMATSMYRDMQAGQPVEVDQILGDLVARAQALGVAVPRVAAACARLWVYQNRLQRA